MNKWLALIVTLLLVSCTKDTYHYPDVKEEFFSGLANADSLLVEIITDDGVTRQVTDSEKAGHIAPDSLVRLIGYYEDLSDGHVKVHSISPVISPLPVPAVQYADSVPTAPVSLQSSWLGYQHLNMVLNVMGGGRIHKIVFLEIDQTPPDADGVAHAAISIHHDDKYDAAVYQSRAYASLPLYPYLSSSVRQLDIKLCYLDYDGSEKSVSFAYKP